ncbi:MAG: zinc ribbon domain-containing protein [Turicibacter sp.]|nr:zinc ribbon domain-containing protein [Turicibacter sp.]
MENTLHCQSCYMAMDAADKFGTEVGGQKSEDYCVHCYQNGAFTTPQTLAEAVEGNIPWWKGEGESDEVARARIMEIFPKLKRWNV